MWLESVKSGFPQEVDEVFEKFTLGEVTKIPKKLESFDQTTVQLDLESPHGCAGVTRTRSHADLSEANSSQKDDQAKRHPSVDPDARDDKRGGRCA